MATRPIIAALLILPLIACGGGEDSAEPASETEPTASTSGAVFAESHADVTLDGTGFTLAGVTFTPPGTWESVPAGGMRAAEYYLPAIGGDSDSASLVVFFFGAGGAGGTEANITRWISQIAQDEGAAPPLRGTATVDGMPLSWVELGGSYNPGMGGGMAAGGPREGYHLVGAVLEAPGGALYLKLTGPKETVLAMAPGFVKMVMTASQARVMDG